MSESTRLLSLMFALGRRMRDEGRSRGKEPNYSMLHFQTLRYVEEQKKPLMHDVAGFLCVTPPAATLLVDGLVKDGFLARTLDKKDRRAVRLSLTKKGKVFLTGGAKKKAKKLQEMFSVLTAKERIGFIAALEKVAKGNS